MKIKIILPLLIAFVSLNAIAQQGPMRKKRDQLKSMKVAFITSELDLTSEESAKFWPLYNAHEEKQQEIRKQKLKSYLEDDSLDKVSEKDAATILEKIENSEEELHQSRKKFITSLKAVISPLKILKLKKAEENFNRKLLQQYRNKRSGR